MPTVFVYSDGYYANLGAHVFPIQKYRLVYRELKSQGLARRVIEPVPATREALLLVHTPAYVTDLLAGRWSAHTESSELPLSAEIVKAFLLATGGTVRACTEALAKGCAVNLAGGFHHAFPDRAEGFCYINDMAVAIRKLQEQKPGIRVAVIDCDLHQGNGTAFIFGDDETVYTFSIHQRDLYPLKQDSNWDIHLRDGVGDDEYLDHLQRAVPAIIERFKPDFVLYQAGADPYEHDQLGDLCLSIDGLKKRDELIFERCQAHGIPAAALLGGGYAIETRDTVTIHVNTCQAAIKYFG